MKIYKRIGAFVTGGPADAAVLDYAARLAELAAPERVYVVGMPELNAEPGKEPFADRVQALLQRPATAAALGRADLEVETGEGSNLDVLLHATRDRDLDLLILGRRLPSYQLADPGLLPRLIRKAPCSLLLVNRHSVPQFRRILVPVDFSRHAGLALVEALHLRELEGGDAAEVICQHVEEIPYGYAYAGVTRHEYASEQRRHAEESFDLFLRGLGRDRGGMRLEFSLSESVPTAVTELALAERADLVALGSRGRTRASAILLGSKAEKLVSVCAAPLLVVKEKGETLKFLDALLASR